MFNIGVKDYENAVAHTITVVNRELFWVKINYAQVGLGVKHYLISLVNKSMEFIVQKILQKSKLGSINVL